LASDAVDCGDHAGYDMDGDGEAVASEGEAVASDGDGVASDGEDEGVTDDSGPLPGRCPSQSDPETATMARTATPATVRASRSLVRPSGRPPGRWEASKV
jgi:hypothetical protein